MVNNFMWFVLEKHAHAVSQKLAVVRVVTVRVVAVRMMAVRVVTIRIVAVLVIASRKGIKSNRISGHTLFPLWLDEGLELFSLKVSNFSCQKLDENDLLIEPV